MFAVNNPKIDFDSLLLLQSRFTNPVYESMYTDATEPSLMNTSNGMRGVNDGSNIESISHLVHEEKTGLLPRDKL